MQLTRWCFVLCLCPQSHPKGAARVPPKKVLEDQPPSDDPDMVAQMAELQAAREAKAAGRGVQKGKGGKGKEQQQGQGQAQGQDEGRQGKQGQQAKAGPSGRGTGAEANGQAAGGGAEEAGKGKKQGKEAAKVSRHGEAVVGLFVGRLSCCCGVAHISCSSVLLLCALDLWLLIRVVAVCRGNKRRRRTASRRQATGPACLGEPRRLGKRGRPAGRTPTGRQGRGRGLRGTARAGQRRRRPTGKARARGRQARAGKTGRRSQGAKGQEVPSRPRRRSRRSERAGFSVWRPVG